MSMKLASGARKEHNAEKLSARYSELFSGFGDDPPDGTDGWEGLVWSDAAIRNSVAGRGHLARSRHWAT